MTAAVQSGLPAVTARTRLRRLAGTLLPWAGALGVVILAVLGTDGLAASVRPGLAQISSSWRGAPLSSPWTPTAVSPTGTSATTVSLHLWLRGDDLTARYTLTTGKDAGLVTEVNDYPARMNGDHFVTSILGEVRISEQKYGVSGDAVYWDELGFSPPVLQQAGATTTVVVNSGTLRVDLPHQDVSIARSAELPAGATETITVTSASGRITHLSGASFTKFLNQSVVLGVPQQTTPATPRPTAFLLSEGPGNWLTGLRAAGQVVLPTAINNLLIRLVKLLAYGVLLWALGRIQAAGGTGTPASILIRAAGLVVAALAVLDVLGAAVDATYLAEGHPQFIPPEVAGPLGLLMGLVLVAWPIAVFCCARGAPRVRSVWPRKYGLVVLAIACSAIGVAYVEFARHVLQVSSGTLIGFTAALCYLAFVLAFFLPRTARSGATQLLVIPGVLAALLLSTLFWPALSAAYITHDGISDVNLAGKWLYLLIVAVIVTGLCVLGIRAGGSVISALSVAPDQPPARRSRAVRWRWAWACAWSALVTGSIVPSALRNAALTHPHLSGLPPASVIAGTQLVDALPELLDWVLLAMAAAALATMPLARQAGPAPDACMSRAIRWTGIGMFAILLCQAGRWMYVPVSLLAGYLTLSNWAMPPGRVLDTVQDPARPAEALDRALASWRDLDFIAGQHQSITTGSADALRDVLVRDGAASYQQSLRAVARSQSLLGRRREQLRLAARHATSRVFDHEGLAPSAQAARAGLITGCVFAVVPALVLLLSSNPPGQATDYPALDFLGQSAWTILLWPFLGWSIGYFLPYLRGDNGVKKALWLYLAVLVATLPAKAIYSDGAGWISALIFNLELFAFLLICSVVTCEFLVLRAAGLQLTDWTKVHNWRFVVTWSSTVLAALGTAAATFLSTAATDLGQQAVPAPVVQAPTSSPATHASSGS